jgi:hypothetical protein
MNTAFAELCSVMAILASAMNWSLSSKIAAMNHKHANLILACAGACQTQFLPSRCPNPPGTNILPLTLSQNDWCRK